MAEQLDSLITSRGEFQAALRSAFAEAADAGGRELWLVDTDFAEWPLGERAVIEQLERWAVSSRKITLVASSFDEVARLHPRWVAWRQKWSHIASCRSNAELESGEMPTVMLVAGVVSVRLSDPVHHRGRVSRERAEEVRCRELVDAVLQRSEQAFPAGTTGL